MTLVVFDLDGCLIDSRRVVHDAYRWAGVEAPENVLELEGVDWISKQLRPSASAVSHHLLVNDIRRAKATRYLATVGKAKLLPPYSVARDLRRDSFTCVVLSGAPVGTIDQVRRRHAWTWPFIAGLDGIRSQAKFEVLKSMARDLAPHDVPVYVDDQRIRVPAPWRYVCYRGQTEQELRKEITG